VNKSGLYSEFESKEQLFLACLRYYLDNRSGGACLSTEPLGWDNIQKFLQEAPSCTLDQRGCFSVNSMRELPGLPPEARKLIIDSRTKLKRLLKANIAAENPKMDVDVVCDQRSFRDRQWNSGSFAAFRMDKMGTSKMDRRDQKLLDKQMRRLTPPRNDGVIAVLLAATFLVGMTLSGVLSAHKTEPIQIASMD
jgi:AcrR family transcriptional regulator